MPGSLIVAGLGYLAAGHVTRETVGFLEAADRLFYLVGDPVSRHWLTGLNASAEDLHGAYAEGKPRNQSYAEMVERLLAPAREGLAVCAAFYGHPGVLVEPGHAAIRQARREGIAARMLPAVSAEDCLFADLGFDPGYGCQTYEASDFLVRPRRFDPGSALVLWQIGGIGVTDYRRQPLWSRRGLELLAARLGAVYGAEHEVVLYEAARFAVSPPRIDPSTLAALPAAPVSIETTLFVPPLGRPEPDLEVYRALGLDPPPDTG